MLLGVVGFFLVDTALNIEAMSPSMIVLRHGSSGACHLLSRICRAAIINAGDGMHEHPTQALLDAYTIRERKGRLEGLKVAIVGDLLHSRVLRSNILLLRKMGADVWVCGPATLIPPGLDRLGVQVTTSVEAAAEVYLGYLDAVSRRSAAGVQRMQLGIKRLSRLGRRAELALAAALLGRAHLVVGSRVAANRAFLRAITLAEEAHFPFAARLARAEREEMAESGVGSA